MQNSDTTTGLWYLQEFSW